MAASVTSIALTVPYAAIHGTDRGGVDLSRLDVRLCASDAKFRARDEGRDRPTSFVQRLPKIISSVTAELAYTGKNIDHHVRSPSSRERVYTTV